MRVLIVDDDTGIKKSIRMLVESMGHTATCAENGLDAINLLTSNLGSEIEAVITDMQMPVMDGIEFLDTLRDLGLERPCLLHSSEHTGWSKRLGQLPLTSVSGYYPFVIYHCKLEGGYIRPFLQDMEEKLLMPT
jgi:CheY-like chemotaxis protein